MQVQKCGDIPCKLGICTAPHLPPHQMGQLYWLPDPQPDANRPGHFLPFAALKGQETAEDHCPSLLKRGERSGNTEGTPPGMLVGQRLRDTVVCGECSKPCGIYAQVALTAVEKQQLAQLKELV